MTTMPVPMFMLALRLGLAHQSAGQGGEGVGDAQPHGDGEGWVDGGGPDHVPVVPRGSDGQAQPGPQESHQQQGRPHRQHPAQQDLRSRLRRYR